MRLHVLQHVPHEGPAAIETWAINQGHSLRTTRLYANESLPSLDEFEMLVVMGGPMNIYQDRDYPWLKPERKFLEQTIAAGRKMVGACLGSQLIADALGARVMQNSQIEIGWHPVRFSDEARKRLPSLPETQDVLHWHGDTFELPKGAIRIAASVACAEQGFWFEDRVLALQFHPEITPETLRSWCRIDPPISGGFVQGTEEIIHPPNGQFDASHQLLFSLLNEL